MFITLTPMRRDDALTLQRAGDVLVINGTSYDFTPLPEGALLPRAAVDCDWLASDVTRTGGQIRLTLILPHGPLPVPAPAAAAVITHPAPIHLTGDGPVALPHWAPPADPAEGATA
ncbi:MAG: hypothetical protein U5N10_08650 [Gemmobacter sp.]|nr:hypothetical protein [Gemmobacter sp.]